MTVYGTSLVSFTSEYWRDNNSVPFSVHLEEHEEYHKQSTLKQDPDICEGEEDGAGIYNDTIEEMNREENKAYEVNIDCLEKAKRNANSTQDKLDIDYEIRNAEKIKKSYK